MFLILRQGDEWHVGTVANGEWHTFERFSIKGHAVDRVRDLNGDKLKNRIIDLIRPCLERDATLQKVIDAIYEL